MEKSRTVWLNATAGGGTRDTFSGRSRLVKPTRRNPACREGACHGSGESGTGLPWFASLLRKLAPRRLGLCAERMRKLVAIAGLEHSPGRSLIE